ncbi:MAG TPA: Fic family protein, partial [Candidatus Deferrimicrobiaceae bacterium]|nr:Fic family protein [Candidatus Deferrimicrobiaceae bacterium]
AIRYFKISHNGNMGCMSYINEKTYTRILAKKMRLETQRPLSATLVEKLHDNMEIAYTYNSNAIEGNTLSLGETRMIIREGLTVRGKSLIEHLEAKNHPRAIAYIENLINNQLEEPNIREIHNILFSGLCENPGNYRNAQVYLEGSDYVPPPAFEVPGLVLELVEWLKGNPEELRPIELAAVFHYKLVAIHPFDDGNGRVGRLLLNLLLIQKGYPFTVIKTVDKQKYYDCLHKADADNLKPLVNFVARCVEQSLDLYLQAVEPTKKGTTPLSLSEAAKFTPYSQEYLSLLARQGKIAATKIGRNWQITQDALNEYLSGLPKKKKQK